jgi:putative nucleotidyltransferase with HDIG domain
MPASPVFSRSPHVAALTIALTTLLLVALVYLGGGTRSGIPHLLYLPVVFASLRFHARGGMLAGLAAALLTGPFMPLDVSTGESQPPLTWLIRSTLFFSVGALNGSFVALYSARVYELATAQTALRLANEELTRELDARREAEARASTQETRASAAEGVAGRRARQLASLRNIDLAIIANHDLRLTLEVVLAEVSATLAVDATAVWLLDDSSNTLRHAASRGLRTPWDSQFRRPLTGGHAGRSVLAREMILLSDLGSERDSSVRAPWLAQEGIKGYATIPLIVKGECLGVLEVFHRAPLEVDLDWRDALEVLAGQVAIAIDNATLFEKLQRTNRELILAYDATIKGWSRALDLRDKETEGHSIRVTELTVALAREMGMSEQEIEHVQRGALLHDIGKMGIPDAILLKPGPLTDEEWEIMRCHPQYGYDLLAPIQFLRPALDIPYYHHEKWDGSGYPHGLKGERIPLAARLFAVVDVWDALCNDRPYRRAWDPSRVTSYLQANAGSHFDPQIVEVFLRLIAAPL